MPGSHDQQNTFEIIARGLYVRSGRVLVCRSVSGGHCYLPGGHVEFGERPAAALAREFAEETGLLATIGPPFLVAEGCFSDSKAPHHEFSIVFHVEHLLLTDGIEIGDREPPDSLEPQIRFEWIPHAELASQEFRPQIILDRLAALRPADRDPGPADVSAAEIALRGLEH